MDGGGSCVVCTRHIALTKAGVVPQHGPVPARCSGSGLSPSWRSPAPHGRFKSTQCPSGIYYERHSGGPQSRVLNDCDTAAGVDTTANDIPETPISLNWPLEPPELVFPLNVIQSVCVLKQVPRASSQNPRGCIREE